jgi:hypothetical protein
MELSLCPLLLKADRLSSTTQSLVFRSFLQSTAAQVAPIIAREAMDALYALKFRGPPAQSVLFLPPIKSCERHRGPAAT